MSKVNWDRVLTESKAFFQSGLFYILLGAVLMFLGYQLSQDPFTHSAFVFLVVILGLALFLFGTGTNASGENTSGPIKVAIAGGAGVLAMVLGFGVAHYQDQLTTVFKRQRDYGVLQLSLGDTGNNIPVGFDSFEVRANWEGMPLPLWKDNSRVEILVPIPPKNDRDGKTEEAGKQNEDENAEADDRVNAISVALIPKPGFQRYDMIVERPMTLHWKAEAKRQLGFNNEFLEVIEKKVKQVTKDEPLPPAQSTLQIGGASVTPE